MGRKKRVLHLLDSGGMYGAENVIINLSREMGKSGRYLPIIGCITQYDDDIVELCNVAAQYGIAAHRIRINNNRLFKDLPRFVHFLKRQQVDLVHSHGYKASVFGFTVKPFTGIPVMATCHLWFEGKGRPLKAKIMIALEKFFYRFFPVVVSVSDNIKQILLKSGIAAGKLKVIKNGIVLSDYVKIGPEACVRLSSNIGLPSDCFCVLNVARLTEQKAQQDIVQSARLIKMKEKNIKIYIVGEGELREKLEQQIKSLDLTDTVYLLGFRSDVSDLLHLADLFVLPSLDEGMPMALLESVACQTPVICTPVGDIPKLIVHETSGVFVEVGDVEGLSNSILTLLGDKNKQADIALQAWKQLRKSYSSQVMFEQYDRVYSKILNKITVS